MKVKANRKELLQAAERAMKVTRKSYDTTSLEECFLFEVDEEGITLHACTQVAYLKTGCAYTAADGTFSCAFPYDQFVATLKTARSETVVLELLDHKVQLSGGRIRLQIPCMDPKHGQRNRPLVIRTMNCRQGNCWVPSGNAAIPSLQGRTYCRCSAPTAWSVPKNTGK